MIRFHALGGLTVTDDGEEVGVGGPRQRRLLAMLLIHRNHVVSVDRLADAVFAGEPTPAASTTLRSYVARARRLLESPDGPALVTRAPGYLLQAADETFDAACFERGLADGGARLARDDPQGAVRSLRAALALWRGDAYAEFADEDWARPEAERLRELRLVAHERLVEAELACGHATAVIPEVEALAREHPLREEFRAQLMVALYRAGRHADALRVFRDYRSLLVEELGVDPSPVLAAIEQRVLTHDPGLLLTEPTGRPLRGYRLGERLGTGRDGTVYAARVPGVDRELAIRVVRAEIADDPGFVRAFESCAQQLAALRHPGIVPIHDYWREPGAAYLVMRRLTGGTLADRLEVGPLADADVADLVSRVGGALSAAADLGMVHGRVSAESVLFDAAGRSHVTDFALSPQGADPQDDVHDFSCLVRACLARPSDQVAHLLARGTSSVGRPTMADLVTLLVAALTGDEGDPSAPAPNPYKGLRAFEESDAGDFFGRRDLVAQVVERLRGDDVRSRLVLVVGGSGSGKSSMVRAGVVPAVRRGEVPGSQGWFVTSMMPGSSPYKELAECLRSVAVEVPDGLADRLAEDRTGVDRVLRRLVPDGGELLLVVDQLEELFTLATPEDQRAFLRGLVQAVTAPDSRLRVVATLRADFFDRPLAHQPLGAMVDDVTVTTTAMSPAELEAAIVGPAERAGGHVEPALVAELVSAVADAPAALPSLQYTLYELAERSPRRALDLAGYRQLGGLGGAIASRAERLWSSLDVAGRDVVRRVFERLVVLTGDGEPTRRRAARTELDALGRGQAVETIVDGWAQARLLTLDRDPRTRVPTVEIAHEALLREWPRLRGWIEEDREAIGALDRLREAATTWQELGRDAGALYRGARLEVTLDDTRLRQQDLPPLEREFLAASAAARDEELRAEEERTARRVRDNRRLRVQRAAIAGALVVALVGGFIALDQRQQAERERRVATARELAAAAVANTPVDPERAVLLALAAVDTTASHEEPVLPEAIQALHQSVGATRVVLRESGVGGAVDWSPRGDLFVTEGPEESGVVDLRSTKTGDSVRSWRGHVDDVNQVAFSEDGTLLATTGDDGTLRVWDTDTGRSVSVVKAPGARGPAQNVSVWSPSFSPDGTLVAGSWSDGVRVVEVATGNVVHDFPAEAMSPTAFSPRGSLFAYGQWPVVVVDTASGRRRFTADGGGGDLGWSPDGRWLATTGYDGVAQVFDGRNGDYQFPVTGHTGAIWSLDWSPTASWLVTGGDDGTARMYEVTSSGALPVHTFSAQESSQGGAIIGVSFSPDGRRLMGGDLGVSQVTIWDAAPTGGGEWASVVGTGDLLPDGSGLVVGKPHGGVVVLDVETGQLARVVRPDLGRNRYVWRLDVDRTGDRVALVEGRGIAVLDLTTGAQEFFIPWQDMPAPVSDLAWSPDGSRLAVGFESLDHRRALVVLDEHGDEVAWLPEEPGWQTRSVSYSPDGRLVASTHWGTLTVDPTQMPVRIWDVDSQERMPSIDASAKLVELSPGGDLVATSRAVEGVAETWDTATRERVAVLTASATIEDLAFNASGDQLATAHGDGTVRLWDPRAGTQQLVLDVSDSVVESVGFARGGSMLVTRDRDGITRVWALDLDDLVALARDRLTRGFTGAECRQYLRTASCPAA